MLTADLLLYNRDNQKQISGQISEHLQPSSEFQHSLQADYCALWYQGCHLSNTNDRLKKILKAILPLLYNEVFFTLQDDKISNLSKLKTF